MADAGSTSPRSPAARDAACRPGAAPSSASAPASTGIAGRRPRDRVDGVRHRPTAQRMPRLDRFRALHPALRPGKVARRRSGLDADPELRSTAAASGRRSRSGPATAPGELRAAASRRGSSDGTTRERPARHDRGRRADPSRLPYRGPPRAAGEPLIAICMATFNPDPELFRTQVESIRAQTDHDWVCLISDDCSEPERFEAIAEIVGGDERFVLSRADERLGFYRNFERVARDGARRGRARRALRPRRPLVSRTSSRRCARRSGRRRARLQRPAARRRRRDGARGDALGGAAQQPHEPRLAPDLEHDRRAPPACSAAA